MNIRTNKEISWFLFYAFVIPLFCIGLMRFVPVFQEGSIYLILFGIEAASPFMAAVLVTIQLNGVKGLKIFMAERYVCNLNWRITLFAFLMPALILTMARAVTYFMGYNSSSFFIIPDMKRLIIILWAFVAEELGWRGYLQDKFDRNVGAVLSPLLIGVIWALWHYHFFIIGAMEGPLLIFFFGCILESYGYYVLMKLSKGNVVPASLWHFSGNFFLSIYLFNPQWNGGSFIPYLIANLFYGINIFIFIYYRSFMRKKQSEPTS